MSVVRRGGLLLLASLVVGAAVAQPAVFRVMTVPKGAENGTSWDDACTLQFALDHFDAGSPSERKCAAISANSLFVMGCVILSRFGASAYARPAARLAAGVGPPRRPRTARGCGSVSCRAGRPTHSLARNRQSRSTSG